MTEQRTMNFEMVMVPSYVVEFRIKFLRDENRKITLYWKGRLFC